MADAMQRFAAESVLPRMINNNLFGGANEIWIHETEEGKQTKRKTWKAKYDAWLLKHPLGIMFEIEIIPLGFRFKRTPLGDDIVKGAGLSQSQMEFQVQEIQQQLVKDMLRVQIKKMGLAI